jgi:hypothetical protein
MGTRSFAWSETPARGTELGGNAGAGNRIGGIGWAHDYAKIVYVNYDGSLPRAAMDLRFNFRDRHSPEVLHGTRGWFGNRH